MRIPPPGRVPSELPKPLDGRELPSSVRSCSPRTSPADRETPDRLATPMPALAVLQRFQHAYMKQGDPAGTSQEVVGNEEIAAIIGPKQAETVRRVSTLVEQRLCI